MRDPHVRLTEEEQRRLEALEAALSEDDPRLARRLSSARRIPLVGLVLAARPPSRGVLAILSLSMGAALVLATLLVSPFIAFGGVLLMAAGGYLTTTTPRVVRVLDRVGRWIDGRVLHMGRRRPGDRLD
jgi:hypothetical protein